jgi:hypothetical protein
VLADVGDVEITVVAVERETPGVAKPVRGDADLRLGRVDVDRKELAEEE